MTPLPHDPGGDIVGPGGPFEEAGVVVDTRRAVLLDSTNVALVGLIRGGEQSPALALKLEGPINRPPEERDREPERTAVLYLMGGDSAAALVTEIVGIASREGGEFAAEFMVAMEEYRREIPHGDDSPDE